MIWNKHLQQTAAISIQQFRHQHFFSEASLSKSWMMKGDNTYWLINLGRPKANKMQGLMQLAKLKYLQW